MSAAPQHALVVLAKQPLAGRSKTRLARDVGEPRALELARAFVLDTLATTERVPGARRVIAYAPASAREWFRERAHGAQLVEQPEGDLGARIRAACAAGLATGADRVIVIGMDSPQIGVGTLAEAARRLDEADVVLGPSLDGGYVLVGVRRDEPGLFRDVPWSTGEVLAVTLDRCAEADLTVAQLEPEFDVDEGADLARLEEALRRDPTLAPHTRAVIVPR